MAAYVRGVRRVIDFERQFFAARGTAISVESKRYVRALRRKPVRIIFPESEPDKVPKETPQSHPGGENVKSKTHVEAAAHTRCTTENDVVTAKNNAKAVTFTKDQIDGLRYERALPGDKRLGYINF